MIKNERGFFEAAVEIDAAEIDKEVNSMEFYRDSVRPIHIVFGVDPESKGFKEYLWDFLSAMHHLVAIHIPNA